MTDRITQPQVVEILQELDQVHNKRRTDEALEYAAIGWHKVLKPFSRRAVELAIREYHKHETRFYPKPFDLAKYARQYERPEDGNGGSAESRYWRWERNGKARGEPCPVCGSKLEEGGAAGRMNVYHDEQAHEQQGVGFAGPRLREEAEHRDRQLEQQPEREGGDELPF